MAYFNECPICGAHLDPGEKCDCKEKKEPAVVRITVKSIEEMLKREKDGQLRFAI